MEDVHLMCAREYVRRARRRHGDRIRDVRLFGSRARGDHHEGSDVDLFPLVEGMTWQEEAELSAIPGEEFFWDYEVRICPLIVDVGGHAKWVRDDRRIARDIAADGVPL